MNPQKVAKKAAKYQMEQAKAEMTAELIGDVMSDDLEDDEEAEDELVAQILAEVGIQATGDLASAPVGNVGQSQANTESGPVAVGADDPAMDDLEARMRNLQNNDDV